MSSAPLSRACLGHLRKERGQLGARAGSKAACEETPKPSWGREEAALTPSRCRQAEIRVIPKLVWMQGSVHAEFGDRFIIPRSLDG